MAYKNYFLHDDNLRIKVNKILGFHPYRTSYPTLNEISAKFSAFKDEVNFDFSNAGIKDLTGLKDLPWSLIRGDAVTTLDFTDNQFSGFPINIIDKLFNSIGRLRGLNLTGVYLPTYIKYYLLLKHNEYPNSGLLYDKLCPVKDTNLLKAMNQSINLNNKHEFIGYQQYGLVHQYFDDISLENILDSIRNVSASNQGIKFLSGLEYCRNLETLDLSDNFLLNYNNHLLAWSLVHLTYLNLSNNPYLKETPNLENCYAIQRCYLNNTRFYAISELTAMSNLRELDISDTAVASIATVTVNNFPLLTIFKASNLGLSTISSTILNSQDLEELRLDGNSFTIGSLDLPEAKIVDFSDCTFSDPTLSLVMSVNLEEFIARDTNLVSLSFGIFSRVREVIVSGTSIADIDDVSFVMPEIGFEFLEVLDLSDTLITTITKTEITSKFMKSTHIILSGCNLTMDTQKILEKLQREGYTITFDKTKLYNVLTGSVSLR